MREPYAWNKSDLDFTPQQRLKLASRALRGAKTPEEYLSNLVNQYDAKLPDRGVCTFDILKDASSLALVGQNPSDAQIEYWKGKNYQFGLLVERHASMARGDCNVAAVAREISRVMNPAMPQSMHNFHLIDRSNTFT